MGRLSAGKGFHAGGWVENRVVRSFPPLRHRRLLPPPPVKNDSFGDILGARVPLITLFRCREIRYWPLRYLFLGCSRRPSA